MESKDEINSMFKKHSLADIFDRLSGDENYNGSPVIIVTSLMPEKGANPYDDISKGIELMKENQAEYEEQKKRFFIYGGVPGAKNIVLNNGLGNIFLVTSIQEEIEKYFEDNKEAISNLAIATTFSVQDIKDALIQLKQSFDSVQNNHNTLDFEDIAIKAGKIDSGYFHKIYRDPPPTIKQKVERRQDFRYRQDRHKF